MWGEAFLQREQPAEAGASVQLEKENEAHVADGCAQVGQGQCREESNTGGLCPQKASPGRSAEPPQAEHRGTIRSDLGLSRPCTWQVGRVAPPLTAVPSLGHMDLGTFENPVRYLFFPCFTREVGVVVQSHTLNQASGSGFGALPARLC